MGYAKIKQPLNKQFELKYGAPIVSDMQVQNVEDLIDLRYNYQHKLVWVISHSTYYYLKTGDGSIQSNWERYKQISTVLPWESDREYFTNEVVHLNGVIYRAGEDIPAGLNPETNGDKWITVSGSALTIRYIFENVPTVTIQTNIKNPIFDVAIGTFNKDQDDNYEIDNQGFIKIFNQEPIECLITKTSNDNEYLFSFFENELPANLTGMINVK